MPNEHNTPTANNIDYKEAGKGQVAKIGSFISNKLSALEDAALTAVGAVVVEAPKLHEQAVAGTVSAAETVRDAKNATIATANKAGNAVVATVVDGAEAVRDAKNATVNAAINTAHNLKDGTGLAVNATVAVANHVVNEAVNLHQQAVASTVQLAENTAKAIDNPKLAFNTALDSMKFTDEPAHKNPVVVQATQSLPTKNKDGIYIAPTDGMGLAHQLKDKYNLDPKVASLLAKEILTQNGISDDRKVNPKSMLHVSEKQYNNLVAAQTGGQDHQQTTGRNE